MYYNTCLVISLFFTFSSAEDILTSPTITNWGAWGEFQYCPEGTKVIGYQLKTEVWTSWDIVVDDTCLNGIKFYCGIPSATGPGRSVDTITSTEGDWGDWGQVFWCDGHGYARGFTLRSEEANTAFVDETAANNFRILCSEGSQFIEGDGERWGEWTTPRICKAHQYICGLQTQVEAPKGWTSDDTSLNNVRVKCCNLSSDDLLLYGISNSTIWDPMDYVIGWRKQYEIINGVFI